MRSSIQWAAGLFDGEGCVDVDAPRRWTLRVTLGMTHFPTVRRFRALFGRTGSSLYQQHPKGGRSLLYLVYHGAAAHDALVRMLPFLVTKKAEARIAVQLMAKRIPKKWKRLSPLEKAQWMTAKKRLQTLKRRSY